MDLEIDGVRFPLEKVLEGQAVVDKINEGRREVRRQAHVRALCRAAASQWIEDNPVTACYYQQTRLA